MNRDLDFFLFLTQKKHYNSQVMMNCLLLLLFSVLILISHQKKSDYRNEREKNFYGHEFFFSVDDQLNKLDQTRIIIIMMTDTDSILIVQYWC